MKRYLHGVYAERNGALCHDFRRFAASIVGELFYDFSGTQSFKETFQCQQDTSIVLKVFPRASGPKP